MPKLTLIKCKKKEKPTNEFYAKKYKEIINRTLDEIKKFLIKYEGDNTSKLARLVGKLYLSKVRYCCYSYDVISKKDCVPKKDIDDLLFEFEKTLMSLKTLSPKEFIILFPVSKIYDGDKYDCLDYFSTMKMFQKFSMDKPLIIPDNVKNLTEEKLKEKDNQLSLLIMEYQNKDIRKFNVCHLLLTSMKMKITTGKDLTDTLVEKYPELKANKYTYFIDNKGKKVWINAFGKTMKEKPVIPKGWKVITKK